MKCAACQAPNPDGAKFCEQCAAPLARSCQKCGHALSPTAKFCSECAHPAGAAAAPRFASPEAYTPKHLAEQILSSKRTLEGERKQVTVLFADVKGSMELLADRDPEEARKLLDPVLERMMEAVHRYEGTVNQVMGDGIMALFGAPLAHEDHAVRACYATLRMQEAIARYADELRRRHGVDVQIRVGLNSGEVVVRSIGSDLHIDYTAVGQTTHLAARMEQLARPGSALTTEATLRAAEGYVEVKPLGPTPIRGLPDPIAVYELIGAGAARTRLQAAAARGLSRFVGRDAEVDQLRVALEEAGRGRGQIVAVVGEPGVGKSRLFYEFIHSHRTHGWLVLEASSVSYGRATPYLPLADLLKGYFGISDRDDTRAVRAKVTGNVLTLDEALQDSIAALLWLLDALPEDHEFQTAEAPQRRSRAIEAVKRVLLRESRNQPLVLVFEDLHWIDTGTEALLDALVDSVPTASVLLAVNYRPEYRHNWGNKTYYRQLRIDALPAASANALLDPLLGDDVGLRPLRRLLIERTEGNPLFLEESVRDLVETDVLIGERGAYRLGKDPVAIQVPPTVQAILGARIDRLAAADKELLQAASVIGKDLPWPLLVETCALSDDDLRGGLTRLQAAEFVYEAKLFPDIEYTFKHALTLEVAYGTLLQDRRRAIHASIIAAMERVYADRLGEHVNRLAHHAFRGEVWDKALHYMREADVTASKRSIDAALGGPGETPGHLWWRGEYDGAVALAHRERALALNFRNFGWNITANFRLGQSQHSLGDYGSAIEILRRTVAMLEGDLQRETFGLAGLPSVFCRAWLAWCLVEQGSFDDAALHANEAIAIAEAENQPYSLVVGYAGAGIVYAERGDSGEAIAVLERGLVIDRMSDIPLLFPLIAAPLGRAYALAGRHEDGIQMLQTAVERSEAMEFIANHALRLAWLADAHLAGNQPDAAKRTALAALERARRHGEQGHEAHALRVLGDVTAKAGQPDIETARQFYGAALAIAEPLGMRPLAAALVKRLL